jgi:hypothetical protein
MGKLPISRKINRNLCHYINNFLGHEHHPRTRMKMIHNNYPLQPYNCIQIFILVLGWRPIKTHLCRFLLEMSNFAISLPVPSYIVTLELFNTKLDMDINSMMSSKPLSKVIFSKIIFIPLTGPNCAFLALVLLFL